MSQGSPKTSGGVPRPSARARDKRETNAAARRGKARSALSVCADGLSGIASWAGAHKLISGFVVIVLALLAMLYGPVREYYAAMRTGQDLQAKYDDISRENASLAGDLNRLQSREGIEDEARRRGYVSEGETSVTVKGLPEEQRRDPSAADEYQDTRDELTRLLDALFRYDPVETWNS
ncbi:FtsB family cell division protein [Olsenella urininfantis]|uniref:FtsB family cell division protein n=1 Tax=Olsenella urininfantis TaxID=1871033 RepID=UPI001F25350D|nr:septum formation initiator family protein [Olsenella urininfantis]